MNNIIPMSQKELFAFPVIRDCISRKIKNSDAADKLQIDERTVYRMKAKVKKYGIKALKHKSRGKRGHHRIPDKERTLIKTIIKNHYADFTPSFTEEKLREGHGIIHDRKTISAIMDEMGLLRKRNKRKVPSVHREWREPKPRVGELVQFDGSYDYWFEERTEGIGEICLLAAIDDATSAIQYAEFAPHEGLLPVLGFWKRYIEQKGLPQAIYLDKFSTYKMHMKLASENPDTLPQFGRAMKDLGVTLHFANSPQAKGRVERLFRTLQDRLIKELRLKGINDIGTANVFLADEFIPDFNRRFARVAKRKGNLHKVIAPAKLKIVQEVLSRHDLRSLRNDFTIVHGKNWYQLKPTPGLALRPKDIVEIRTYPDSSIAIYVRGKKANYSKIPKQSDTKIRFHVKNGLERIPTLTYST